MADSQLKGPPAVVCILTRSTEDEVSWEEAGEEMNICGWVICWNVQEREILFLVNNTGERNWHKMSSAAGISDARPVRPSDSAVSCFHVRLAGSISLGIVSGLNWVRWLYHLNFPVPRLFFLSFFSVKINLNWKMVVLIKSWKTNYVNWES